MLVVVLTGLLLPEHWGLLDVQPHPLWIVVLAIAIRYGSPSGYVAGALAGISYTLLLWARPESRFEVPGGTELLQGFLLFLGGMLVSEAVQGQRRRLARLELEQRHTRKELEEVTVLHESALEVKSELEKRIVGQPASVATLYEMAKKLNTLRTDELYPAVLDLTVSVLEAEACALYLRHDGGYHLHAGRPDARQGRSGDWSGRPRMLDEGHPLVQRALRERRVVTIRDHLLRVGAAAASGESALMVGPLFDRDGEAMGVVVVERLPFLKLTPASTRLFGVLLDWASRAVQNAALFEQVHAETPVNGHSRRAVPVVLAPRAVLEPGQRSG